MKDVIQSNSGVTHKNGVKANHAGGKHKGVKEGINAPSQQTIVQPKLELTTPGDSYEREADRMADFVMRKAYSGLPTEMPSATSVLPPMISRRASSSTSGVAVDNATESGIHASRGGGQPMPTALRSQMESSFEADFSGVRLHTGSEAEAMSNDLSAKAFTYGNDVFFNNGQYQPYSAAGQHLIAHELTHVVQQSGKVGRRKKNETDVIVFDKADTIPIRGMDLNERRNGIGNMSCGSRRPHRGDLNERRNGIGNMMRDVGIKKDEILGRIEGNFTMCNQAVTEFVDLMADRVFFVSDKLLLIDKTLNEALSLIGSIGSVASFVLGFLLSEVENYVNSEKSKFKRNCVSSFQERFWNTKEEETTRESNKAEGIRNFLEKVKDMINCIDFKPIDEIDTCFVMGSNQSQLENGTKVGNVTQPEESDIISTKEIDEYDAAYAECERVTEEYKNRKVLKINNQNEFLHQLILKFLLIVKDFNVRYDIEERKYVDGSFLGKNSKLVDVMNETMDKPSTSDENFNYNVLAPVLLQKYREMINDNNQLSDKDFTLIYKKKGKEYVDRKLFWEYANRFLKHYGNNSMQYATNEFIFNDSLTMSDKKLLSKVVDHIRQ